MLEFKILKKSKKSRARLGIIKTPNGEIETPCLVPVATQAAIKTLTSEETLKTKTQILICNAYHLHLRPGEKIIRQSGGLNKFMNWPKPMMTDSGGFQVFSLGFGRDFNTGKIFPQDDSQTIKTGQQPKLLKITPDGVFFRSYLDGQKIFLGPKDSMKIQEGLGADIIFTFDECTSPLADYKYTKRALEQNHRWAKICLKTHSTKQALFGIVHGGKFKDLREQSSKLMGSLPFAGFGIGGDLGSNKTGMLKIVNWALTGLPETKPRHLLGIGHPEDIPKIIKAGIDTFDCIAPTHYARRGIAFITGGQLNLAQSKFLKDKKPLDKKCLCEVCQNHSRAYISHLFKAREISALRLLTFHNLFFFNSLVEKIREEIKKGRV